jgi:tetratricopeptide (TPR) repeat protein
MLLCILYTELAMIQSIRTVICGFSAFLVLILCLPISVQSQDQNTDDIEYLEGELYQRALHFSVEQVNRAVDIGNRAIRSEDPERRSVLYKEMMEALNDANRMFQVMKPKPKEYEYIPDLINNHWANEHNTGVELIENLVNSDSSEERYRNAEIHFNNAIFLQPDSAQSYIALSTLKTNLGEIEEAISLYEMGMERLEQPRPDDFDYLINLYFVENQMQNVKELTLTAQNVYPEELTFTKYLADYYLETGDYEAAERLIRELLDKEGEKAEYYFILGSIYQDRAAKKFSNRDLSQDLDQKIEYDESGRIILTGALEEYEKAIELDPDNREYWRTIYHVYSVLGIHHKADLAYEKAEFE